MWKCAILTASLLPLAVPDNVLFIPQSSPTSHMVIMVQMALRLRKDGHRVSFFTWRQSTAMTTGLIPGDFEVILLDDTLTDQEAALLDNLQDRMIWETPTQDGEYDSHYDLAMAVMGESMRYVSRVCDRFAVDSPIVELLASRNFTFALVDYVFNFCSAKIPGLLGIPYGLFINMPPFWSYERLLGNLVPTAYATNPVFPSFDLHKRAWGRFLRVQSEFFLWTFENDYFWRLTHWPKNVSSLAGHLWDVWRYKRRNVMIRPPEFLLSTTHPILDMPRPTVNSIVKFGPLIKDKSEALDTELRQFLEDPDPNNKGTVLMSLTTFGKGDAKFPVWFLRNFMTVFLRFPWLKFVIRHSQHDSWNTTLPKNVLMRRWVPQQALLAHDKIRAFVTHNGISSSLEGLYFGKVQLCVPLAMDQFLNAAALSKRRAGVWLYKDDTTNATRILQHFRVAVKSKRFHTSTLRWQGYLQDHPDTGADLAIFKIESFLRHHRKFSSRFHSKFSGGSCLEQQSPGLGYSRLHMPKGRDLNFLVLYSADVIACLTILILIIVLMALKTLRLMIRWFYKMKLLPVIK